MAPPVGMDRTTEQSPATLEINYADDSRIFGGKVSSI
jgi:hypothetical protein